MESLSGLGGYFGLDLPDNGDAFPAAIKFQSGRAALRAVLERANIGRVLLPAYICGSVIQTVIDAGAAVETYRLDDSLYPKDMPALGKKSAVLYVNYFGLCGANIGRLLEDIPREQLIIDNSQALFTPPSNALATVYSLRKFVGVPDGGLLVMPGVEIEAQEQEDRGSVGRTRHLLLRMAYTAPEGYSDYLESENSLSDTRPLSMSRLTRRMLAAIDMTAVKMRRRENFKALADRLAKYNSCKWCKLDSESVPLCYPVMASRDVEQLKKELGEEGIYIPTYWLEVRSRAFDGIEHRLVNCCLPVPCDQRYSVDQMADLAAEIASRLDRW
jgi:hypothetical protein